MFLKRTHWWRWISCRSNRRFPLETFSRARYFYVCHIISIVFFTIIFSQVAWTSITFYYFLTLSFFSLKKVYSYQTFVIFKAYVLSNCFVPTGLARCLHCQRDCAFDVTLMKHHIINSRGDCLYFLTELLGFAPAGDNTRAILLSVVTASTAAALTASVAAGIPTATRISGIPTKPVVNAIQPSSAQCQTQL